MKHSRSYLALVSFMEQTFEEETLASDEITKSQEPLLNSMDPDNGSHPPLLNSMDPDNGSHPPLLNYNYKDPDNGSQTSHPSTTMVRSESWLAFELFLEQTIEEGTETSNKISCTPSSTVDVDVLTIDYDEEYNHYIPNTNFDFAFDEVVKSQEPLLNSMDPDNGSHPPLLNYMDPDNGSHPPLLNYNYKDPDNGSQASHPSTTMVRSESWLAFELFLEQTIEEGTETSNKISCTPSSTVDVDVLTIDYDEEYNHYIPSTNFDFVFDKVVKSQEPLLNSTDPDDGSHPPLLNSMDLDNGSHPPLLNYNYKDFDNGSHASHPPMPILKESGNDPSELKNKYAKVVASVPFLQKKPIKSTSGSSDDEEVEREINNMDSSDAKRAKRMLANRESARRSRAKKQARITELETQVFQDRDEISTLSKSLRDMTQKYMASDNDKRLLQAQVEALKAELEASRTHVELLQEKAKIGMHHGLNPMTGMPYVPVQEYPNNHFYQPTSTNLMHGHDIRGINYGLGGNVSSTQSVTYTSLKSDLHCTDKNK